MCDTKKYKDIYKEISHLQPEDTLEIILESDDPKEQQFYEMVGDFLMQIKQDKVIKENKF